jgi:SPP1 gp7 family putative phage head morphogenesis protein
MSNLIYLQNSLTKHQLFLQRYGGGWWKANKDIIEEVAESIQARVAISGLSQDRIEILALLFSQLDNLLNDKINVIKNNIRGKVPELSAYEAGFTQRLMGNAVESSVVFKGLQTSFFDTFFENEPLKMVVGDDVRERTLDQLFDQFTKTAQKEVRSKIFSSLAMGDTTPGIAKAVSDMVGTRTKRQAETLVRTAANHVGNATRAKFFEANDDVLQGYLYSATLDNRTTILCASRDGKRIPENEDWSVPAHFGCRSVHVPDVKDEYKIFKDGGKRASQFGQVSGKLTYSGFLRRQSKAFQNEVLGPKRAQLFRSGKLTLDKFVNDDGVLYTLEELSRLEDITIN